MFKPLLASSAGDAASQITSADRSLGTAELSELINLYRSLEPSRQKMFGFFEPPKLDARDENLKHEFFRRLLTTP